MSSGRQSRPTLHALLGRGFAGNPVPSAAGGSLMFTPDLSTRALETMHSRYGAKIYGRYGFVDAFNPKTNWTDTDVIGINAGIILLSAENMRTGNIWRWFMQNREIPTALMRVGLLRQSIEAGLADSKSGKTVDVKAVRERFGLPS